MNKQQEYISLIPFNSEEVVQRWNIQTLKKTAAMAR
nr:MAG TPA: hypothetical protein [Caudoviricetes sp.]